MSGPAGEVRVRRALVSVSDKSGLAALGGALARHAIEVLSTGGTAKALRAARCKVTEVSKVTRFPEMLDGRVKTLHPAVHAGLLADRGRRAHMAALSKRGIRPIDLVVSDLYPFEAVAGRSGVSDAEAIEQVDIGGPAMVRSAAKNFASVAVVVDGGRIPTLLAELAAHDGATTLAFRRQLAAEAFARVSAYDAAIASYLAGDGPAFPDSFLLRGRKVRDLRYGENPHQRAALYAAGAAGGIVAARQLSGKELSYNNLLDADAASRAVSGLDGAACVIVKHLSPCGAAVADDLADAYGRALVCDPVSAFGGIVALNREVDEATAREMAEIFLEVVVAPAYSERALHLLSAKKALRLLLLPAAAHRGREVRSLSGGFLVQDADAGAPAEERPEQVTRRAPTDSERRDLRFAWKIVPHVRSNGIVLAHADATVGIGAGQTNRISAVRQAIAQAGERARGSVLASDAFFPFADGIEEAAKAGAGAVIQPGGSVRDPEVIAAADAAGMAMLFTKVRRFRH